MSNKITTLKRLLEEMSAKGIREVAQAQVANNQQPNMDELYAAQKTQNLTEAEASVQSQIDNTRAKLEAVGANPDQQTDTRNPLEKMLNLRQDQNLIFDIFELINRPQQAIFNTIKHSQGYGANSDQTDTVGAFFRGLTGQDEIVSGGELLRNAGMEDNFLTHALGFGLDVFADPADLALLPVSALANVGQAGAKAFAKVDDMVDLSKAAVQGVVKNIGDGKKALETVDALSDTAKAAGEGTEVLGKLSRAKQNIHTKLAEPAAKVADAVAEGADKVEKTLRSLPPGLKEDIYKRIGSSYKFVREGQEYTSLTELTMRAMFGTVKAGFGVSDKVLEATASLMGQGNAYKAVREVMVNTFNPKKHLGNMVEAYRKNFGKHELFKKYAEKKYQIMDEGLKKFAVEHGLEVEDVEKAVSLQYVMRGNKSKKTVGAILHDKKTIFPFTNEVYAKLKKYVNLPADKGWEEVLPIVEINGRKWISMENLDDSFINKSEKLNAKIDVPTLLTQEQIETMAALESNQEYRDLFKWFSKQWDELMTEGNRYLGLPLGSPNGYLRNSLSAEFKQGLIHEKMKTYAGHFDALAEEQTYIGKKETFATRKYPTSAMEANEWFNANNKNQVRVTSEKISRDLMKGTADSATSKAAYIAVPGVNKVTGVKGTSEVIVGFSNRAIQDQGDIIMNHVSDAFGVDEIGKIKPKRTIKITTYTTPDGVVKSNLKLKNVVAPEDYNFMVDIKNSGNQDLINMLRGHIGEENFNDIGAKHIKMEKPELKLAKSKGADNVSPQQWSAKQTATLEGHIKNVKDSRNATRELLKKQGVTLQGKDLDTFLREAAEGKYDGSTQYSTQAVAQAKETKRLEKVRDDFRSGTNKLNAEGGNVNVHKTGADNVNVTDKTFAKADDATATTKPAQEAATDLDADIVKHKMNKSNAELYKKTDSEEVRRLIREESDMRANMVTVKGEIKTLDKSLASKEALNKAVADLDANPNKYSGELKSKLEEYKKLRDGATDKAKQVKDVENPVTKAVKKAESEVDAAKAKQKSVQKKLKELDSKYAKKTGDDGLNKEIRDYEKNKKTLRESDPERAQLFDEYIKAREEAAQARVRANKAIAEEIDAEKARKETNEHLDNMEKGRSQGLKNMPKRIRDLYDEVDAVKKDLIGKYDYKDEAGLKARLKEIDTLPEGAEKTDLQDFVNKRTHAQNEKKYFEMSGQTAEDSYDAMAKRNIITEEPAEATQGYLVSSKAGKEYVTSKAYKEASETLTASWNELSDEITKNYWGDGAKKGKDKYETINKVLKGELPLKKADAALEAKIAEHQELSRIKQKALADANATYKEKPAFMKGSGLQKEVTNVANTPVIKEVSDKPQVIKTIPVDKNVPYAVKKVGKKAKPGEFYVTSGAIEETRAVQKYFWDDLKNEFKVEGVKDDPAGLARLIEHPEEFGVEAGSLTEYRIKAYNELKEQLAELHKKADADFKKSKVFYEPDEVVAEAPKKGKGKKAKAVSETTDDTAKVNQEAYENYLVAQEEVKLTGAENMSVEEWESLTGAEQRYAEKSERAKELYQEFKKAVEDTIKEYKENPAKFIEDTAEQRAKKAPLLAEQKKFIQIENAIKRNDLRETVRSANKVLGQADDAIITRKDFFDEGIRAGRKLTSDELKINRAIENGMKAQEELKHTDSLGFDEAHDLALIGEENVLSVRKKMSDLKKKIDKVDADILTAKNKEAAFQEAASASDKQLKRTIQQLIKDKIGVIKKPTNAIEEAKAVAKNLHAGGVSKRPTREMIDALSQEEKDVVLDSIRKLSKEQEENAKTISDLKEQILKESPLPDRVSWSKHRNNIIVDTNASPELVEKAKQSIQAEVRRAEIKEGLEGLTPAKPLKARRDAVTITEMSPKEMERYVSQTISSNKQATNMIDDTIEDVVDKLAEDAADTLEFHELKGNIKRFLNTVDPQYVEDIELRTLMNQYHELKRYRRSLSIREVADKMLQERRQYLNMTPKQQAAFEKKTDATKFKPRVIEKPLESPEGRKEMLRIITDTYKGTTLEKAFVHGEESVDLIMLTGSPQIINKYQAGVPITMEEAMVLAGIDDPELSQDLYAIFQARASGMQAKYLNKTQLYDTEIYYTESEKLNVLEKMKTAQGKFQLTEAQRHMKDTFDQMYTSIGKNPTLYDFHRMKYNYLKTVDPSLKFDEYLALMNRIQQRTSKLPNDPEALQKYLSRVQKEKDSVVELVNKAEESFVPLQDEIRVGKTNLAEKLEVDKNVKVTKTTTEKAKLDKLGTEKLKLEEEIKRVDGLEVTAANLKKRSKLSDEYARRYKAATEEYKSALAEVNKRTADFNKRLMEQREVYKSALIESNEATKLFDAETDRLIGLEKELRLKRDSLALYKRQIDRADEVLTMKSGVERSPQYVINSAMSELEGFLDLKLAKSKGVDQDGKRLMEYVYQIDSRRLEAAELIGKFTKTANLLETADEAMFRIKNAAPLDVLESRNRALIDSIQTGGSIKTYTPENEFNTLISKLSKEYDLTKSANVMADGEFSNLYIQKMLDGKDASLQNKLKAIYKKNPEAMKEIAPILTEINEARIAKGLPPLRLPESEMQLYGISVDNPAYKTRIEGKQTPFDAMKPKTSAATTTSTTPTATPGKTVDALSPGAETVATTSQRVISPETVDQFMKRINVRDLKSTDDLISNMPINLIETEEEIIRFKNALVDKGISQDKIDKMDMGTVNQLLEQMQKQTYQKIGEQVTEGKRIADLLDQVEAFDERVTYSIADWVDSFGKEATKANIYKEIMTGLTLQDVDMDDVNSLLHWADFEEVTNPLVGKTFEKTSWIPAQVPQGFVVVDDPEQLIKKMGEMNVYAKSDAINRVRGLMTQKLVHSEKLGKAGQFVIERNLAEWLTIDYAKRSNEILKFVDGFNNMFKQAKLLSPAFNIRNFLGVITNMELSGVRLREMPELFRKADEIFQAGETLMMKKAQGIPLVADEMKKLFMYEEFLSSGFTPAVPWEKYKLKGMAEGTGSQMQDVSGVLKPKGINELTPTLKQAPPEMGTGVLAKGKELSLGNAWGNESLDAYGRMAVMIKATEDPTYLKKLGFDTPAEAVRFSMFDPKNLSPNEMQYVKKLIPFYTFTKMNLVYHFENMPINAVRYHRLQKALDSSWELMGIDREKVADYKRDQMYIPLPGIDANGKYYVIKANLPPSDLGEFLGNPLRRSLSALTPLVKAPAEIALNKQFFTNNPIENFSGERSASLPFMTKKSEHLLSQTGFDVPSRVGYGAVKALSGDVVEGVGQFTNMLAQGNEVSEGLGKKYQELEKLQDAVKRLKQQGVILPELTVQSKVNADPKLQQTNVALEALLKYKRLK